MPIFSPGDEHEYHAEEKCASSRLRGRVRADIGIGINGLSVAAFPIFFIPVLPAIHCDINTSSTPLCVSCPPGRPFSVDCFTLLAALR